MTRLAARCTFCLLLAFAAGCASSDVHESDIPPATTSAGLLRTILQLSDDGDYETLRHYIYPVPVTDTTTLRDTIITFMKESNKTYVGDFSYSDEALEIVIDEHLGEITASPGEPWIGMLTTGELSVPPLRKIALETPEHILLLEHNGVRILMVKIIGEYQLLFWQGLNLLLQEE